MPNCNYVISVNVPEGTRKTRRIAAAAYATQHAADVVALQACYVNAIQQAVAPIQPVTAIPVLNAATSIAFPLMGSANPNPNSGLVWDYDEAAENALRAVTNAFRAAGPIPAARRAQIQTVTFIIPTERVLRLGMLEWAWRRRWR